mmetsp:Transcript_1980/g.5243  ORF Transcript_1980/g.5243 Transcript_1980/m.5243 type:complete len:690 (-) Transcript_1980:165-2234(-)
MSSTSTLERTRVADEDGGSRRSQARDRLAANGRAPLRQHLSSSAAGPQDPRVLSAMPSLEDLRLYELPPPALLPDEEDVALVSSESEDAEDYKVGGYHPMRIGETLKNGRYRALHKLGWGHFSTVWLSYDKQDETHVAIKVQKSASHYAEAAQDEIRLLTDLQDNDPQGKAAVVKLLDHFVHRGRHGEHVCLVFEVLGKNLLSLIKRCNFRGAPMPLVKLIAYQALQGLAFVNSTCGIIHTDVKPENILFVPPLEEMERMRNEAQRAAEMVEQQSIRAERTRARGREEGAGSGTRSSHRRSSTGAAMPVPREVGSRVENSPMPSASLVPNGHDRMAVQSWSDEDDIYADDEEDCALRAVDEEAEVQIRNSCHESKHDDETTSSRFTGVAERLSAQRSVHQSTREARQRPGDVFLDGHGMNEQSSGDSSGCGTPESRHASTPPFLLNSQAVRGNPDLAFTSGRVKLVDFGNACWRDQHFTEDIQTRQYRSPEVILGAGYDTSSDVWSLACVVFEVATGDFLFDPHSGRDYDRDEDHLALMQELLGPVPRSFLERCEYARDFYDSNGDLIHIRHMNFWTLSDVLREKYRLSPSDAVSFGSFLMSMLQFEPARRFTAEQCLHHPWLQDVAELIDSMNAGEPCGDDTSASERSPSGVINQSYAGLLTEILRRESSVAVEESAEALNFQGEQLQ